MSTADANFASADGAARSVLVVDDDEGMRMLLQVSFDLDTRYERVAAVGSRAEVFEHLDATSTIPDVVLVDVTLPDGDGVELIGELRARLPRAVLALYTGWSDPEIVNRARAGGADHVFSKALDPQEVLAQLADPQAAPAP